MDSWKLSLSSKQHWAIPIVIQLYAEAILQILFFQNNSLDEFNTAETWDLE